MIKESTKHLKTRIEELEAELALLRQSHKTKTSLLELLLQKFKKQSNNSLTVIDKNFNLLEINKKKLNEQGKIESQIIGEKCYNVFYDRDEVCEECTVKQSIESRQSSQFLKLYDYKTKLKFEEKSVTPIIGESGEVETIVIDSKDISGYHQLVDSVSQRDEFFKNIFETSGDAFLIHDEKGKILEFGARLPKLLGYTHHEIKGLSITDIDAPDNPIQFYERQQQFINEEYLLFETNLIKKTGEIIPVEVSSNLVPLQSQRIFFVSLRSLERRNKAEEQLRISEKRFRTLVENAPDLIMRFDTSFRHLFVNAATQPVLGIDPDKFIGKTHQELGFPADKCEFWEEAMSQVFRDHSAINVEFSIETSDGIKYFDWQLIPEFENNGAVNTIMAIARDITARKMNEQALEKAVKTKDKFFSIIAHDLKNPFNVMIPMVDMLKNNFTSMSHDQISEIIQLLGAAVKQEYNLLENLLEWARSQMGAISQHPQNIDLRKLVDNNILLHKVKQDSKQISVQINQQSNHPAFADEYMIDTVIRNLLSNALKFTESNGEVGIDISENKHDLLLSIRDNGMGISPENQEKLFRIDTNYTRTGTKEETGTGLGLILCKEFIEKNGGRISLQSEEGEGSTFTVRIPKSKG